jgi:hypothetical protein
MEKRVTKSDDNPQDIGQVDGVADRGARHEVADAEVAEVEDAQAVQTRG